VRATRPLEHPSTAQALRVAVGYASAGLRVAVALPPAVASTSPVPPPVARALHLLRTLDLPVVRGDGAPLCDLCVTW
jgi:hypothetical protein